MGYIFYNHFLKRIEEKVLQYVNVFGRRFLILSNHNHIISYHISNRISLMPVKIFGFLLSLLFLCPLGWFMWNLLGKSVKKIRLKLSSDWRCSSVSREWDVYQDHGMFRDSCNVYHPDMCRNTQRPPQPHRNPSSNADSLAVYHVDSLHWRWSAFAVDGRQQRYWPS